MFRHSLLSAIVATVFAIHAGCLHAAVPKKPSARTQTSTPRTKNNISNQPIIQPAPRMQLSESEHAAEMARREKIIEHTQYTFNLLGAEIAHQQGDFSTAIGLYVNILNQTRDPNVAERAMELAIQARAYNVAELVYHKWREIEPETSPAQRRLAWTRALISGDYKWTLMELDAVFEQANDEQRRRQFLLLAQMSVVQPDLIERAAKSVHRLALVSPQLPEAAIADVFFSAGSQNNKDAIAALQRLAQLDTTLTPATLLTLQVLAHNHADLLNQFFAQTLSSKLSREWRELEVESLINSKQYAEAEKKINALLDETPNARLYLMAAQLQWNKDNALEQRLGYLEKAYQSGTKAQQAVAAFGMAVDLAQNNQTDRAIEWAKKVEMSSNNAFDAQMLLATIYVEKEDWAQAQQYAQAAEKMPEQSGLLFKQSDVQRIVSHILANSLPREKALAELTRRIKRIENGSSSLNQNEVLAELLLQRGLLYATSKDPAQQPQYAFAIADLRRYLKLRPNDAVGQNGLGYTLLESTGTFSQEAFDLIYAAYQQRPESAAINDSLGWAYYLKGEAQLALPYLEFAYNEEPNSEVGAHLGEVYWQLGQQDEARKIWRESWDKDPKDVQLLRTLQKYNISFP